MTSVTWIGRASELLDALAGAGADLDDEGKPALMGRDLRVVGRDEQPERAIVSVGPELWFWIGGERGSVLRLVQTAAARGEIAGEVVVA